jgi:hypothetical protein
MAQTGDEGFDVHVAVLDDAITVTLPGDSKTGAATVNRS